MPNLSSCVLLCVLNKLFGLRPCGSLRQSANELRYTIFILAPLPLYFPSLLSSFTKSRCSFPFPLQPQNTSTSNHSAMKLKQRGLWVHLVFGHKLRLGAWKSSGTVSLRWGPTFYVWKPPLCDRPCFNPCRWVNCPFCPCLKHNITPVKPDLFLCCVSTFLHPHLLLLPPPLSFITSAALLSPRLSLTLAVYFWSKSWSLNHPMMTWRQRVYVEM